MIWLSRVQIPYRQQVNDLHPARGERRESVAQKPEGGGRSFDRPSVPDLLPGGFGRRALKTGRLGSATHRLVARRFRFPAGWRADGVPSRWSIARARPARVAEVKAPDAGMPTTAQACSAR